MQVLARMMEGDIGGARWGNSVGYVTLPLPILVCEDPLDYVRKGKALGERKKNSLEAIITQVSISATLKMFGSKVWPLRSSMHMQV